MADSVTVEEVPLSVGDHADEESALLDQHIVAYRIDGPLFFAGAHQSLLELASLTDVRVVILRLSRVSSIDATGAAVLRDTITRLERRGIAVLLSGVPDRENRWRDGQAHSGEALLPAQPNARGDRDILSASGPHRAIVQRKWNCRVPRCAQLGSQQEK